SNDYSNISSVNVRSVSGFPNKNKTDILTSLIGIDSVLLKKTPFEIELKYSNSIPRKSTDSSWVEVINNDNVEYEIGDLLFLNEFLLRINDIRVFNEKNYISLEQINSEYSTTILNAEDDLNGNTFIYLNLNPYYKIENKKLNLSFINGDYKLITDNNSTVFNTITISKEGKILINSLWGESKEYELLLLLKYQSNKAIRNSANTYRILSI